MKDTALTVATMIPAVLFWAMVLAGSFHGLVAFGRDTLAWRDGWEYLVPGTLDGVSVTFAMLAFRAVRRGKAPDRCYRVVWGAALASATVNFAYEYNYSSHNLVAGGYLALLSLFGIVMFHEFLDQFEEGTATVQRKNPKFGLRWITWPTNTFCAALAWHNHPPADDVPATVRNAVANLDRVRALKHAARQAATVDRRNRVLPRVRRTAESAVATGEAKTWSDDADRSPATPETRVAAVPAAPVRAITAPKPRASVEPRPEPAATEVRVPATAATLTQWAQIWMRMCSDGDTARGPLNDDARARTRYGLSAKQLHNIRNAATSGALRRKAAELRIELPAGYHDKPSERSINGRVINLAAAGATVSLQADQPG